MGNDVTFSIYKNEIVNVHVSTGREEGRGI